MAFSHSAAGTRDGALALTRLPGVRKAARGMVDESEARPPPRWALGLALVFCVGMPLLSRALALPIGDYAMFARIERYHLDLSVTDAAGTQVVPVRSLASHLSRDAGLVILPAASNGFGKDQTDLLAGGLGDLTRLLCQLHPSALRAGARLGRGPLPRQGSRVPAARGPLTWTEASSPCQR